MLTRINLNVLTHALEEVRLIEETYPNPLSSYATAAANELEGLIDLVRALLPRPLAVPPQSPPPANLDK